MWGVHKIKIKVEPELTIVDNGCLTTVTRNCMQSSYQEVTAIINGSYCEEEQMKFSLIKREPNGSDFKDLVVTPKQEPELGYLDESGGITNIRPNHDEIPTPRNVPIVVKLKHMKFISIVFTLSVFQVTQNKTNNKSEFQCYNCRNCFSYETDCRRHIMSSTCFRCFDCKICDKIFQSGPKLQRHLSRHISDHLRISTHNAETDISEIKFPVVVK